MRGAHAQLRHTSVGGCAGLGWTPGRKHEGWRWGFRVHGLLVGWGRGFHSLKQSRQKCTEHANHWQTDGSVLCPPCIYGGRALLFCFEIVLVFLFSLLVHWSLYLPAVNNLPPCGIRQCGQLIWLGSQTCQSSKFTLYRSWNDFPFYIWFWSISRCVTLPLRTHLTTIPILFWLSVGVSGSGISLNAENKFNFMHRMCWKLRNQCIECHKVHHFVVIETN